MWQLRMGARRHGQGGTCPLEMLLSVLCINSYSKMLSRPIMYALFSQFFVRFWGLCNQTSNNSTPLDPDGGLSSPDP